MALKGVVGNFSNFYLLALLLGFVSPATAANCSNSLTETLDESIFPNRPALDQLNLIKKTSFDQLNLINRPALG